MMTPTEFDAWMIEHGWSNRLLATRLDVAVSTVARWRSGGVPISRLVETALEALAREPAREDPLPRRALPTR